MKASFTLTKQNVCSCCYALVGDVAEHIVGKGQQCDACPFVAVFKFSVLMTVPFFQLASIFSSS